MNFAEYLEKTGKIPETEGLELKHYCFHSTRFRFLPLEVVSLNGIEDPIIRIPESYVNSFGIRVRVDAFSGNLFCGKTHITDIILSRYIRSIPEGAFSGCSSLRRITIPRGVKRIWAKTFEGCSSLEDVYYEGSRDEWDSINIVCRSYECDFGGLIPGTPVQELIDERFSFIPGNEALFSSTIHFNCDLSGFM